MAFDAERAARRLTDAGMEQGAATGVADLVHDATGGLATEASLQAGLLELRAEIAHLEARIYRALWLQGAAIVGATAAIMTIVRVLG
ncbi:MAG: hypothetical protein OXH97_05505 [Chloroflexota bacterium]|nr:hypothetical protein [Chloroflexota bacterium]